MRARAPASTANLGPGFDTLALALSLHVEVEVEPADSLVVRSEGEGADFPTGASHLAAQVAIKVSGHDRLAITVRSEIPVARGLGSSAALVAAAAAAAGSADPLGVAAEWDGHPENAAASVMGGLVTAAMVAGRPVAARMPLDPALGFVVLVPRRELATREARAALPPYVPHQDAAFNLGRMGLLLAGLADRRSLLREATDDKLHQAPRTSSFPEAPALLDGLVDAGALASCWSGAGPSVLVWSFWQSTGNVIKALREKVGDWAEVRRVTFSALGADVPEL
jgi:homoserine kinase